MAPHVLVAPNAFKNALSAAEAADAIKKGLQQSRLDCTCECFPVADGGDGTTRLILDRLGGKSVETVVADPLGRKINAPFGLIDDGKTAVIEMADASGLRLLTNEELNPMYASTAGVGQLIRSALDLGVKKLIIGLGGSATVDGGCGLLHTLGVRFLDASGIPLPPFPKSLLNMRAVDQTQLDPRVKNCEWTVLCDVTNRLLGKWGTCAVFAAQKGATTQDIRDLETFLSKFAGITLRQTGKNMRTLRYGGSAGGVAAALWAYLGAKLVDGATYFLERTKFQESLRKSDMVITGEGCIDHQTLRGKAPVRIALMAKRQSLPVVGIAGSIPLNPGVELQRCFDVLMPISQQPMDLCTALSLTRDNLTRTATALGNLLAVLR